MKIGAEGIALIKKFEGLFLNAYLDPIGIPTIGWGTIKYPNGKSVKMGDKITLEQAEEYLLHEANEKTSFINSLVTSKINQNQFDALASFAYNLGTGALKKSTLLKKVNANPIDASIRDEFNKWNKAGGKVLRGLVIRRTAEGSLYFKTN